jgi:hypothetical protein
LFSVSHSRQSWLVFSLPRGLQHQVKPTAFVLSPLRLYIPFVVCFFQPIWYYRFSMGKFSSTITFS